MQARSGLRYNLDELLFILQALDNDKTIEEVASSLNRSQNGLRARFSPSRSLEDGKTSLRGVKQYKSLAELYNAFGEELPSDPERAKQDVLDRVKRFQESLRRNLDE